MLLEKLLGPDQVYDVPPLTLRLSVAPAHTGLLLLATRLGAFTKTLSVDVAVQTPSETVSVRV
jgi:hypothetical protein